MINQTGPEQERLRQEAETRLRQRGLDRLPLDWQDAAVLLDELRIHHVELEIQNEELLQVEQALERSEENYRHLYDQAPIAYFVLDLKGLVMSVNRIGAELLGYPPEQIRGAPFERFVALPERDTFYHHREQVIDTEKAQQLEVSLLPANRQPRRVVVESAFRPPGGEDQAHLLMAVIDRTEQQWLQEAYRQVVEHSLQGLIIFQDERLIFANPAIATMTGYSVAELLAMDRAALEQFIPPENRAQIWAGVQASLAGHPQPADYEFSIVHRSGQTRWLEGHSVVIEYQGSPAIQISVLDITGRKTAEQALEQFRKFIERVNNVAPMVIYIYDLKEGRNIYINEQVEMILGYTIETFAEFQSDLVNRLIHPEDRPKINTYIQQLAAGELAGQVFDHEYRFRHSSGEWCWVQSRDVVFSRTAAGLPRQVLGILQDVTRRKEVELEQERLLAEVRRQSEELRALSARLAEAQEAERKSWSRELHDQVGQSLTALGFNLKFVRGQLAGQPDPIGADERLGDSLALLEEITDRVRDLMTELHPPMIDEDGLIDSLEWYAEKFANRTGLVIRVEDRTQRHRLTAAAEIGLFRIFQEALTNVAKHAQAGQVRVTLEEKEDEYRLVIADDGLGFDPAIVTGGPSSSRRLGLLTMRERAQAIGGRFQIESQPGWGTRVIVEVPAQ